MANKTRGPIVDDEADILDLLEYNLEKEGYEVIEELTAKGIATNNTL